MIRHDQQCGFILHARAYRETSLLLECFLREHGRIGLIARGVRRERTRLPRGMLQPLQPLALSWAGKGELCSLTHVESLGAPLSMPGDALYSAMYLNELVLRLSERNDPHPQAYDAYVECLQRLATGQGQGWSLRRFERDWLASLGYALVLDRVADSGQPIDAAGDYSYLAESGPVAWRGDPNAVRVSGAALLALARDEMPNAQQSAELRRLMRALVRHQLAGGQLNAWALAAYSTPARDVSRD